MGPKPIKNQTKSVLTFFWRAMAAALGSAQLQDDQEQGLWLALEGPLGLYFPAQRGLEAFQTAREEVSDADCVKDWFLKDVLNEITTFAGSLKPQNIPETIQDVGFAP